MKRTKFWMLPLLALVLAGCTSTPKDSSSSQNSNGSSESEKTVSKVEANTRLISAIEKTINDDIFSLDASASGNAEIVVSTYLDLEEEPLQVVEFSTTASASVKAKDLDLETAQFAATFDFEYEQRMDLQKTNMAANGGIYYVDNFGYVNLSQTISQGGQSETETAKLKYDAGPFPTSGGGLIETIVSSVFGIEYDAEALLTEANLISFLPSLNAIDSIEATESEGVLTIVYTITVEDIVDIVLDFYLEMLEEPTSELTSEQLAVIRAEILAEINNYIVIRTAKLTVKINEYGLLAGFGLELDADFILTSFSSQYVDIYDELGNYIGTEMITTQSYNIVEVQGEVALGFEINKPVTISFPDFTDYYMEETGNPLTN